METVSQTETQAASNATQRLLEDSGAIIENDHFVHISGTCENGGPDR